MVIELSTSQGFLFPGQGVQSVGMSADVRDEPKARRIFARAEGILDFGFLELISEGPEDELNSTANAQPAIFVDGIARNVLLTERGYRPDLIVGHSLGEFTGLTAAGVLSFEDGLRLVRKRGELTSSVNSEGSMLAVLGLGREVVEELIGLTNGEVTVANYNSPKQVVLSGSKDGLDRAGQRARQRGGKTIQLDVSGPFHSPLMSHVEKELSRVIDEYTFNDPDVPIISSVSGTPVRDGSTIKSQIKRQMTGSVDWVAYVHKMIELGIETTIEVGPDSTLKNLTRRVSTNIDNKSFHEVY
ncbi:MAG: ACP S-malonyltransferase [Candidatus Acetothermia bacterium]